MVPKTPADPRGKKLSAGDPRGALIEASGAGGTVIVRAPVLGTGVEALAPSCEGCSVEP